MMKNDHMLKICWLLGLVMVLSISVHCSSCNAQVLKVENLWPRDFDFEVIPPIPTLPPAYKTLWMESLDHKENDLKLEIISSIEEVHLAGSDQSESAPKFRSMVSKDNHHLVNMALVSLLVSLDDRESADALFGLLNPGRIEISQIVEPALAKWQYGPIIDVWKTRLKNHFEKGNIRHSLMSLALDGLRTNHDEESFELLKRLVESTRENPRFRLAAADAIGQMKNRGLEQTAARLAANEGPEKFVDRLCAIKLLNQHDSDPAKEIIKAQLQDAQQVVAGAAWKRILELDSATAVTFVNQGVASDDPWVRGYAVQALIEQPNLKRIKRLGKLLDDRHPNVRKAACEGLFHLAQSSSKFDKQVRETGTKAVLESPSGNWGVEQSLILLTSLDHKPVAKNAVELLKSKHFRVSTTAAWALSRLQVKNTLPKMLKQATQVSDDLLARNPMDIANAKELPELDLLAHLFDAFGEMNYQKAEPLLMRFVPKRVELLDNCRPAAVTALGKFYAGKADDGLVRKLATRMKDVNSDPAERDSVCSACAIAMGRMRAKSAVRDLNRLIEVDFPVGNFSYGLFWALQEIEGAEIPKPVAMKEGLSGFRLRPGMKRLGPEDTISEASDESGTDDR